MLTTRKLFFFEEIACLLSFLIQNILPIRFFLEDGFDGWKNREVIQIAALKIDEKLEVSKTAQT